MLRARSFIVSLAVLLLAGTGQALTLDFESEVNGQAGPLQYVFPGVTVDVVADTPPPGNHLGLAVFDSDPAGPNSAGADPDLLVDTGNILILQNNNFPAKTGNVFNTPNDDENGGQFFFNFSTPVQLISLGLIDINAGGMLSVILRDSAIGTRTYSVPNGWNGDVDINPLVGYQDLDLTTLVNQIGIGNGQAATAVDLNGFDASSVVQLEILFSGSAGVDNLVFVPEPGTALLVGLGLLGLGLRGRRA
jgi:hypothetical protein